MADDRVVVRIEAVLNTPEPWPARKGGGEVTGNCQRGIKSTAKETGERNAHPENVVDYSGQEEPCQFEKKGVRGGSNGKRAVVGEPNPLVGGRCKPISLGYGGARYDVLS